MTKSTHLGVSYYSLLGVHLKASNQEIRRAYRELSKHYHPDTTNMPKAIATAKFHQINAAYATLIDSDRRLAYDQQIRDLYLNDCHNHPVSSSTNSTSSSIYLEPTDRPLSAGELFALFIMAMALVSCLVIAITIAFMRPEATIKLIEPPGVQVLTLAR